MVNSSMIQENTTLPLTISSKIVEFAQWTLIPSIIGFIFFLCFITLILNVFFKTPTLRENARYVLFVFLLFNDALFVFLGFYFMLASMYLLHIPMPLCYILYTLSGGAFHTSPCNLAAMAVEQYIAICHPLRHVNLCTPKTANAVFTMICSIVMIPYVAEFCVMVSSRTNIFNLYMVCEKETLVVNAIQKAIRFLSFTVCFIMNGLIIMFTYVKVILVANRVCPESSSASKAGRTVMIHAFQILLCTSPLLTSITRVYSTKWPPFVTVAYFLGFTCFPRFLSPLVYGIRDEILRLYIKKSFSRYLFAR
ncbi:odorant receptor 131-2-like [Anomaloglossus baeobatrachus]|uniref:odorant receptor 131-2-like n=1 Tax=Anomaloglossus baeobatrachus TaxID=238106 RepID=UPI003F4FE11F